MPLKKYRLRSGFAAVVVVAILMVSGLALSLALTWLSLDDLTLSQINSRSRQLRALGLACMDEAWQKWRYDETYAGESLSLSEGSCIITVSASSQVGGAREFLVLASSQNYTQASWSLALLVDGKIQVLAWQEPETY